MLNYLNELKDSINIIIKKHKVFFFVFLACVLTSIVISIIASINYFYYFSIKNLTDNILVSFLNKKINLFAFFFRRFFQYLLVICLIYLCSCNKYTIWLNIVICCFIAFNVFFNFVILIALFGLFGLIHGIIVTLLVGLIFIITLIFLSLFFYAYLSECSSVGSYFKGFKDAWKVLLVSIIIIFILSLFEVFIIPFSTSAFIIVF